jgi:6-phosphogluconolactonase
VPNIILSGGKSAKLFYEHICNKINFYQPLNIYFADERITSIDSIDSNYNLILNTLFRSGIPDHINLFRIQTDGVDINSTLEDYGKNLPLNIDLLILGVGADGHIASIFPNDLNCLSSTSYYIQSSSIHHPYNRITITPNVIALSKEIWVLAFGVGRAHVRPEALKSPTDVNSYPVRLVLNAKWWKENDLELMRYKFQDIIGEKN